METVPNTVLTHWGLVSAEISAIESGLINKTFLVQQAQTKFILQNLNPIFDPCVHHDIATITEHLHKAGLATPRLLATQDARLWVTDSTSGHWRLFTYMEGHCYERLQNSQQAFEAGLLLGRFHRALSDLRYEYKSVRLGVHDTKRHMQALRRALASHPTHRYFKKARELSARIFQATPAEGIDPRLPHCNLHGDPKISNIVFSDDDSAVCFVDLDTLAKRSTISELADALRSWCAIPNQSGHLDFQLDAFENALHGYADSGFAPLTGAECRALVPAIEFLALELATRFCSDALCESYFSWDASRYADRSSHNLDRAQKQYSLSQSVAKQGQQLEELVSSILI